jgi:restriction system protein
MDEYKLENFLSLDAVQFGNLVNILLTKMGLIASTTKRSGDGGIDIIATTEQPIFGGKYVIQRKRYTPGNNVGEPAVRDLFGVMMHENANKGILITTADFSRQAKSFSEPPTRQAAGHLWHSMKTLCRSWHSQ